MKIVDFGGFTVSTFDFQGNFIFIMSTIFASMTSYQTHGIILTQNEDIGDLTLLDIISNSACHIFSTSVPNFNSLSSIMGNTKILVQSHRNSFRGQFGLYHFMLTSNKVVIIQTLCKFI